MMGTINNDQTRKLSQEEYSLAEWLLQHGHEDARDYLPQLEQAEATNWVCACGCASIQFKIRNKALADPGVHVLSDYVFGDNSNLAGVFIYASQGILSGLEVYGLAVDAPSTLPKPAELRPFGEEG